MSDHNNSLKANCNNSFQFNIKKLKSSVRSSNLKIQNIGMMPIHLEINSAPLLKVCFVDETLKNIEAKKVSVIIYFQRGRDHSITNGKRTCKNEITMKGNKNVNTQALDPLLKHPFVSWFFEICGKV